MITTKETKLKAAKEHVDDHVPIHDVCKKYGIDASKLKYFCALYKKWGEKPFIDKSEKNRCYTKELKLKMVKRYLSGESGYKLALEMGCTDQSVVRDWANLYKKKGDKGLVDTHSRRNYLLKNEREKLIAHKRLINRNKYLEAENEVLKKWYSLNVERGIVLKKKS